MTERKEEPGGQGEEREPTLPADEEAAWAQIVAGYGERPEMPDDHGDGRSGRDGSGGEDRSGGEGDRHDGKGAHDGKGPHDEDGGEGEAREARLDETGAGGADDRAAREDKPAGGTDQPVHSFTVYAAGTGPRSWQAPDDPDDDHFTPPEPPPLPEADAVTKFGWLAAVGGPLLLIGAVLFDVYMSWWIVTLGVGGFLGGFATLLTRLRESEDEDDPGGGAVV